MEHTIKLQPFTVPNFVLPEAKPSTRFEGFNKLPSIPLADLSVETLDKLCAEFRKEVFLKANKTVPVYCGCKAK